MNKAIVMLAQIKENNQTSQIRYAWFSNKSVSIDQETSKTVIFDLLPPELKHQLRVACENNFRSLNISAQKQLLSKIKDDLVDMVNDLPVSLRAKLGVIS